MSPASALRHREAEPRDPAQAGSKLRATMLPHSSSTSEAYRADKAEGLGYPSRMPSVLLVDDDLFLEHRAREPHPESPERLLAARRAVDGLRETVAFEAVPARDASNDELARVHTPAYLEALGQWAGRFGALDADTFVSPSSIAASRRAAGGALAIAEALTRGHSSLGVGLLRPPGHHARPGSAMGFCLLNNAAVAAAHARALGAERVLVLDWDVHHGNGTEEIFYADPGVLYVSLHQAPYYPGSGAAADLGAGDGRGYNVNLPLSAGADDAVYLAAFEGVIGPIIEAYRPSLAIVSAGFDAHVRDPLGGMELTDLGYAALARRLKASLPEGCPIGVLLEGGYDLAGLEGALAASLQVLAGGPLPENVPTSRAANVSPTYAREISRSREALSPYWSVV
jgi:acetoin utilization deacetylase AcuC-like enzyme